MGTALIRENEMAFFILILLFTCNSFLLGTHKAKKNPKIQKKIICYKPIKKKPIQKKQKIVKQKKAVAKKKIVHKKKIAKPAKKTIPLQKLKQQIAARSKFSISRDMPEHKKLIGNRLYTQHALERMAPSTPAVIKELQRRALKRGYKKNSHEFYNYVKPRNISPALVERTIRQGKITKQRHNVIKYVYKGIAVIATPDGMVITVYR